MTTYTFDGGSASVKWLVLVFTRQSMLPLWLWMIVKQTIVLSE